MHALAPSTFGPLEIAILEIFWTQSEPMTVRQVHDALHGRGLAYTTILTTMVRMMEKGWLDRGAARSKMRQSPGRGHTDSYTAVVTKGALLAAAIEETCARLGADRGDRAEALAALLD